MIVRRRNGAVLRQLGTLYNAGTIGDLTDGQLLERFATDAGEVAELAFSALVERHEPLVWRVCLAIVRDEHDAEDAFQATFLVLVRRGAFALGAGFAGSLASSGRLPHGVVSPGDDHPSAQTPAELRGERCKPLRRTLDPRDPDVEAVLHAEVNRLPEISRAVVLCDLEGRTHQEAARFLGWPIGTVKSRQSHGRSLIRDRLVRRGWGLAVAGAVVQTLRKTAVAAIPERVSRSAVSAVIPKSARLLAGYGVPAHVLALTQGVLRAMLWNRLRFLTVAILAAGIASGGASVYVLGVQEPAAKVGQPVSQGSPAPAAQTSPPKDAPKAPAVPSPKLRAQQLAARRAYASYKIAQLTRELAEIAVEEYEEVIYPRDLAAIENKIKLAAAELPRSEDRLTQARSERKVLVEYTKSKRSKELRSEVEKARSDEEEKQKAAVVEDMQLQMILIDERSGSTK